MEFVLEQLDYIRALDGFAVGNDATVRIIRENRSHRVEESKNLSVLSSREDSDDLVVVEIIHLLV